jgi:hypothetical protein
MSGKGDVPKENKDGAEEFRRRVLEGLAKDQSGRLAPAFGATRGPAAMKTRILPALVAAAALLLAGQSPAEPDLSPVQAVENAITELDLERARHLLETNTAASLAFSFERARLAVYSGDCETAQAILDAPNLAEVERRTRAAGACQKLHRRDCRRHDDRRSRAWDVDPPSGRRRSRARSLSDRGRRGREERHRA